ncbi:MAG: LytTR family DNA-binding domain-containing protein [Bacteroidia bacterium]|jgi:two-component system LytT family response regulator|nr:LytTR family DNA-binding domain-containing protein [Bacteroidia bacterium]
MKAILIDDSADARQALKADIARWCPQLEIAGEASGMVEGLQLLRSKACDVVFLDIQLGDGDGFQLLEQLGNTKAQIIFTTGLDNYGIRAIKFSALDYLLKPVDPDELIAAVKKLENHQTTSAENLRLFTEQYKQPAQNLHRLALNSADRVHVVHINHIIRCESDRNYTTFYLNNNTKPIVVTRTLKEYEDLLEPSGFVRVHHSHLINLEHLKTFMKNDGGYAVMSDGTNVPVSVRKKEDLLKALGLS